MEQVVHGVGVRRFPAASPHESAMQSRRVLMSAPHAPKLPPRLDGRGLDFGDLDHITPQEIAEFRASQTEEDGAPQSGFDYLLDNHPGTLKRHKFFSTQIQPPYREARYQACAFGALAHYGLLDFD